MLSFEEIKEKLNSITTPITDENKNTLKQIGLQLGYAIPDCKCKDKFNDLFIALKLWLKNHPTGFPHYEMKRGVIKKYIDGTNIYNLNITDEKAEWLLKNDPEAVNYLKKIADYKKDDSDKLDINSDSEVPSEDETQVTDTEETNVTVADETVEVVENEGETEETTVQEPKKRGRRKKLKNT